MNFDSELAADSILPPRINLHRYPSELLPQPRCVVRYEGCECVCVCVCGSVHARVTKRTKRGQMITMITAMINIKTEKATALIK